ncbi:MAG: PDZ domain-containing protein [Pyrinomonadaceae bacterium]
MILRFDDETVTGARKLTRLINEAAPEHTVKLTIARGGAEQNVSATLGKREDKLAENFNVAPFVQDNVRRQLERLERDPNLLRMNFGGTRRIGVSTMPLTEQLADYFKVKGGALVSSVTENSPAAKAGIKAGDVITEVDNQPIQRAEDVSRALNSKSEGEVTLKIVRDKHPRTIKLTPERGEQQFFKLSPTARMLHIPSINIPPMRLAPPKVRPVRPLAPLLFNPLLEL